MLCVASRGAPWWVAGVPVAEASLDPCSWRLLRGEWGPAPVLRSPRSACSFPWPVEDAGVTVSSRRRDCTDLRARHPLPVLTRTAGTLPRRRQEEERPQGLDTETLAPLTRRDLGPGESSWAPQHHQMEPTHDSSWTETPLMAWVALVWFCPACYAAAANCHDRFPGDPFWDL